MSKTIEQQATETIARHILPVGQEDPRIGDPKDVARALAEQNLLREPLPEPTFQPSPVFPSRGCWKVDFDNGETCLVDSYEEGTVSIDYGDDSFPLTKGEARRLGRALLAAAESEEV